LGEIGEAVEIGKVVEVGKTNFLLFPLLPRFIPLRRGQEEEKQ